jgi:hypothetical protein
MDEVGSGAAHFTSVFLRVKEWAGTCLRALLAATSLWTSNRCVAGVAGVLPQLLDNHEPFRLFNDLY